MNKSIIIIQEFVCGILYKDDEVFIYLIINHSFAYMYKLLPSVWKVVLLFVILALINAMEGIF